MGKSLNFGSGLKEGVFLANRCFFYHSKEETVDHILPHSTKTWIL